jgi:large subunit ribosomal protein L32e
MKMNKKKVPDFKRNIPASRKLDRDKWRKPRGIDNKKRVRKASEGPSPNIGYKNPEEIKGLHPSGYREVLVRNESDMNVDPKIYAIRFSSTLGKKKLNMLYKKAIDMGFHVLNPPKGDKK